MTCKIQWYLLFLFIAQYVVCIPYAITGAKTFGLGVQPRLEIRDIKRDRPLMYNLYLLALQAFKAESQTHKLSYFQITGIHGYPNVAWDNVTRESNGTGYCVHGEEIFGTWHRPYVALYEQRLQYYALKIAKQFKEGTKRERYIEEAKKLRSAYWDWARPLEHEENAFPEIFLAHNVSVETPGSGHQTIPNPFYQYHFHPLKPTFFKSYYQQMQNTIRWPYGRNASEVTSDDNMLSSQVTATRKSWQLNLYQWFVQCNHFYQMNDAKPPKNTKRRNPKCNISLETIHGDVHAKVGGFENLFAGHMTVLLMSGFDPLFFLHHTNIDRILAMWQVIYPDEYVYKSTIATSTYVYKKRQPVDQDTALKPFHRSTKGDFWTSREVRDHRIFQYTYPEFIQGGNSPDSMRKIVNQLYGPKSNQGLEQDSSVRPERHLFTAANSSSFEYIANIAMTKNKFAGPLYTYLFLGEPTSSTVPQEWINDESFVGSLTTFSRRDVTEDNAVLSGSLSLTDSLSKRVKSGRLPDLSEDTIVPYLTNSFRWKVVGPDGSLIDSSTIPDFRISVYASTSGPLTDPTKFPKWSAFIPLPSVTDGKLGKAH